MVAARILIAIGNYLEQHPIGEVSSAETGFTLARNPDTVRAPDVAYLRADRVPTEEVVGCEEIAPDLAVEVLSPGDRDGAVRTKVADWLAAGTTLVWVVDPPRRSAVVHRADGTTSALTEGENLEGESVLPGFAVSLARVLAL